MPRAYLIEAYICANCPSRQLRPYAVFNILQRSPRSFTTSVRLPQSGNASSSQTEKKNNAEREEKEIGAMSRRLTDFTNASIGGGGREAKRFVENTGFSEELKKKLEARIEDTKFRNENSAAFAEINMPASAGKGTREQAAARPWSGTETVEDAALRMLNDAHKPLRRTSVPKISLPSVDLRMKKVVQKSRGERLANARDRTSIYELSQNPTMTEEERSQMRQQLKERFTSGARPMPGSVQGLAALANERIEDAIARGQFKNIPRGKGKNIERDYTASSPFLDTTEYFMNKIIQKQEIVPPWIEKQQELIKAAAIFRSRLRSDWRRHAARTIASKGGSLESQIRRAKAYAAAEAQNNPKTPKVEAISGIDEEGKLSQVTVTEIPLPGEQTEDAKITVVDEAVSDTYPSLATQLAKPPSSSHENGPPLAPLRDPAWEDLEKGYQTLAIANLNNLARSYNLMAPDLAKKPYFNLERELRACFADVAPQLPAEIEERARSPAKITVEVVGHRPGGVLERFAGKNAKVYDSRKPNYGFRDFWKDLWRGDEKDRAV